MDIKFRRENKEFIDILKKKKYLVLFVYKLCFNTKSSNFC